MHEVGFRRRTCTALLAGLLLGALGAGAQAEEGRVMIREVVIQGNRQVSTEQIRRLLKTRPGQEYVPEVMQQDVRDLYSTHQFGNVYADKIEVAPGQVKVVFTIRDYPSVIEKVEYRGATVEALEAQSRFKPGDPFDQRKAGPGIVRLHYEVEERAPQARPKDSHPGTQAEPKEDDRPEEKSDGSAFHVRESWGYPGGALRLYALPIYSQDGLRLVRLRYEVKEGPDPRDSGALWPPMFGGFH